MLYAIRRWGLREVLRQWWEHSWFRGGELVGVDAAGNRYYQVRDPRYFQAGKDRYVEYGETGGARPDASMIPPHWHGWLHHTYEHPPSEADLDMHSWINKEAVYCENMTGSANAHVPVPTVPNKIAPFAEPRRPPIGAGSEQPLK